MPTTVRVTIYDANIDRLFLGGGDVWDWMERTGRQHLAMALVEVPRRSGHLASMHNLALTPYKKRGVRYSVGNYAEYAHWVHNGTHGPIMAGNGFWDDGRRAIMGPMSPWFTGTTPWAHTVSGQSANPWISRAAGLALARYGYHGNAYPG